jgi:hypothetical protein
MGDGLEGHALGVGRVGGLHDVGGNLLHRHRGFFLGQAAEPSAKAAAPRSKAFIVETPD